MIMVAPLLRPARLSSAQLYTAAAIAAARPAPRSGRSLLPLPPAEA